MLSFDDYKALYKNVGTVGRQLKQMSDEAVQTTFDNDIQTKQAYIYDYYHDDQANMEYGYNPALSKTKIPVKLKFIIKSYKSISKDDPEYHIMFEPNVWNSMSCKPDWFVKNYERLGIKFPIGLYVDIPDERDVYHRWMVMYSEAANQFPKFGVLQCNHKFQWITDNGVYRHKREIWGVDATQKSYTSGVWTGDKFTIFEEQDKFYLPWSPIASELKHDRRMVISMLQAEPYVYKITKVDNTSPKGIVIYTVKQDRFEPEHDYVQTDMNALDYGDMYADYYSSAIEPCKNDNDIDFNKRTYNKYTLVIETVNDCVKLGASKILTAKIYDGLNNDVTSYHSKCIWDIKLNNVVRNDLIIIDKEYSLITGNEFKCKFKFIGDEQYLNSNINVTCQVENMDANIILDIVAL